MNVWNCGSRSLAWGDRTLIMGVINVTPDSFSDGGLYASPESAIRHGLSLAEQGADILDIGGESTRPGASPVSAEEECSRVLPVVTELAGTCNLCVSIDTVHYETACRCIEAGACIINDVSGLQVDPRLASVAAESGAGLVLMHMRGTPKDMQTFVDYEDISNEIRKFLEEKCQTAIMQGVKKESIVLDPGIGFSKTAEQNLVLLNALKEAIPRDYPVLVGVSRKSFLGEITGKEVDQRTWATAAAVTASILNGAHIVRVHDVAEMVDVVRVADSIRTETIPALVEV